MSSESPTGDPLYPVSSSVAEARDRADAGLEQREQLALLWKALRSLDEETRDLLVLHDTGQMPLTDLAQLLRHDRKTVRKRLVAARRRISRLVSLETPLA